MNAALFDLDGVLVDSESSYTRIWDEIVSLYPTGIENFAYKIKGNTLERILEKYYPDEDIQRKVVKLLKEREDAMDYPLFPGVTEFLKNLKENRIPAAIVTSSNLAKMKRVFEQNPGFRDYFDAVLTDADVSHSKPHPEGYLKAAQRLGVEPEDCIAFEDSYAGLQSGRSAGAMVTALATTNPRETLEDKADVVIDSFEGITFGDLLNKIKP